MNWIHELGELVYYPTTKNNDIILSTLQNMIKPPTNPNNSNSLKNRFLL